MKHLVILMSMLFFVLVLQAQDNPCKQAPLIISMLNKYHYCPIDINQKTSEEIFRTYIENLDPDNLIFTSADIKDLFPSMSGLLTTSSGEQTCAFLKTVSLLYQKKLQYAEKLIRSILDKIGRAHV